MLDDLRFAIRQLRRSPGYATAVVLTLALGIGVNTAVFSMLDGFLLRSLPYPEPERVAALMTHSQYAKGSAEDDSADSDTWDAVRRNVSGVITAAAGNQFGATDGVNLQVDRTNGGAVRYVQSARVSAHYFDVIGIRPLIGRGFTEDEDRRGGSKAVVLSYSIWQSTFHGDRNILGKPVMLKGEAHTVVGVLPQGAMMPNPADVWTPLQPGDPHGMCGGNNCLILMRLLPGAAWQQVQAQLTHMPKPRNAGSKTQWWFYAQPLQRYAGGDMRPKVQVLMLAVGFILLIACANLAGLALVRISRRTQEIATRLALGASRMAVLRQLWVENLLLALGGAAAGLGLAWLILRAMHGVLPDEMIPVGGFALDARVLGFALGASLLTSLLFGALPALQTRRVDLRSSLAAGSRSVAGSRSRVRQMLIGAEVALAVVLLTGAGLLVRTLVHLETLPPGFDAHNVMTAKASLDDARYHDGPRFRTLLNESLAGMRRISGVESAAAGLSVPYERGLNDGLSILDGPRAGSGEASSLAWVTPGYFETFRIPLLSGRTIQESDNETSQRVAVVNTAFGKKFFDDANPVGRHFASGKDTVVIVGVVGDVVKSPGIRVDAPLSMEPVFYIPAAQASDGLIQMAHMWFQPSWIVRTRGPIPGLEAAMQQAITAADPGLPVSGFYPMEALMNKQLQMQRIEVMLLSALAGLALLLSAIGIYSLVSNLVVQRTREIGIRIALGSTLQQAMLTIGSSGIVAAGAGVVVGLGFSFAALRVLKSEIYGVSTYDPFTLMAVPLLFVLIALAASFLPTLRIIRIEPAETLRNE